MSLRPFSLFENAAIQKLYELLVSHPQELPADQLGMLPQERSGTAQSARGKGKPKGETIVAVGADLGVLQPPEVVPVLELGVLMEVAGILYHTGGHTGSL